MPSASSEDYRNQVHTRTQDLLSGARPRDPRLSGLSVARLIFEGVVEEVKIYRLSMEERAKREKDKEKERKERQERRRSRDMGKPSDKGSKSGESGEREIVAESNDRRTTYKAMSKERERRDSCARHSQAYVRRMSNDMPRRSSHHERTRSKEPEENNKLERKESKRHSVNGPIIHQPNRPQRQRRYSSRSKDDTPRIKSPKPDADFAVTGGAGSPEPVKSPEPIQSPVPEQSPEPLKSPKPAMGRRLTGPDGKTPFGELPVRPKGMGIMTHFMNTYRHIRAERELEKTKVKEREKERERGPGREKRRERVREGEGEADKKKAEQPNRKKDAKSGRRERNSQEKKQETPVEEPKNETTEANPVADEPTQEATQPAPEADRPSSPSQIPGNWPIPSSPPPAPPPETSPSPPLPPSRPLSIRTTPTRPQSVPLPSPSTPLATPSPARLSLFEEIASPRKLRKVSSSEKNYKNAAFGAGQVCFADKDIVYDETEHSRDVQDRQSAQAWSDDDDDEDNEARRRRMFKSRLRREMNRRERGLR